MLLQPCAPLAGRLVPPPHFDLFGWGARLCFDHHVNDESPLHRPAAECRHNSHACTRHTSKLLELHCCTDRQRVRLVLLSESVAPPLPLALALALAWSAWAAACYLPSISSSSPLVLLQEWMGGGCGNTTAMPQTEALLVLGIRLINVHEKNNNKGWDIVQA